MLLGKKYMLARLEFGTGSLTAEPVAKTSTEDCLVQGILILVINFDLFKQVVTCSKWYFRKVKLDKIRKLREYLGCY